jgi:hypothetical protein
MEKLEGWEEQSAEHLEHVHRRNLPDRSGSLDREGFANADGSDAVDQTQIHVHLARLEQQLHHRLVPANRSPRQRRPAVLIRCVNICPNYYRHFSRYG